MANENLQSYLEKFVLVNLTKQELVDKVLELQEANKKLFDDYAKIHRSKKNNTATSKKEIAFLNSKIEELLSKLAKEQVYKEQYKKVADLKLGNTFNANASWVDKIVFVLKEANRPLRGSEIIEILLKNDIAFRTITNKQKGLSTHLTKALGYGRIIGTKQKGQNGYLFSLPD
jgi:hypothetical protein